MQTGAEFRVRRFSGQLVRLDAPAGSADVRAVPLLVATRDDVLLVEPHSGSVEVTGAGIRPTCLEAVSDGDVWCGESADAYLHYSYR